MRRRIIAMVCALSWVATADEPATFTEAQLDQLTAPIALYPDALLAQVLMAATVPQDVVLAADWAHRAGAGLTGDVLASALEPLPWDPSVKALVPFPDVLDRMAGDLGWTTRLGEAVRVQRADVMASVQRLRKQALESGHLAQQDKLAVSRSGDVIVIAPVEPSVVYVPVYDPWLVYGPWFYPAYPPYVFGPAVGLGVAFGFGTGIIVSAPLWGFGWFDWHHHDMVVDHRRWERFDVHRGERMRGAEGARDRRWEPRAPSRPFAPMGPGPRPGPGPRGPSRSFAPPRGPARPAPPSHGPSQAPPRGNAPRPAAPARPATPSAPARTTPHAPSQSPSHANPSHGPSGHGGHGGHGGHR